MEPGTSNLGYYYTARGTPEYTGNAEGAIVGVDYDGPRIGRLDERRERHAELDSFAGPALELDADVGGVV